MNNKSYFLYDSELGKAIDNKMSFATNTLEKYDNVVYHCALFSYDAETQERIDKNLAENGIFTGSEDERVYIVRDGVTTKFSIPSFRMESVLGNINSPINVATYKITFDIIETFSCMLTNELEILSYASGYNGYLQRPYWFEVWFSGFKNDTLEPIARIPLPNGETSLLFEGFMGNVKSTLESTGTKWSVEFTPTFNSLLSKNINILSVSSTIKDDKQMGLKEFLERCAEDMYKRLKSQYTSNEEEAKELDNKYGGGYQNYITLHFYKENENKTDFEICDNDKIKMEPDQSGTSSKKGSSEVKTSKEDYFTTICQEFLFSTDKFKDCVAKYDIKSEYIGDFKNKNLYKHDVKIYLIKDEYMAHILKAYDNENDSNFDALSLFNQCRANNTLVKKYQFGFSSMDTSVLEVFNKYDMLYFMNALPQVSDEYKENSIFYRNVKNVNKENNYNKNNHFNAKPMNGYLEDIYKNLYSSITGDELYRIAYLNNIPTLNNDMTNNVKSSSTGTDVQKDKKSVAAKSLWERLYKSGQMSETKFTILGDPYWIATNAYRTGDVNNKYDLPDFLKIKALNIPNYRCVFIIRSTPDQNEIYTQENPTDYTFEYSMHASGIYLIYKVESFFEDGKFTQKIYGVLDQRFFKELQ